MTDLFNDLNYRRALLIDRYEHPQFLITEPAAKKLDKNYLLIKSYSDSCVDNFNVYIKCSKNMITDIKFSGEGCAIAISSTDFLAEALINKSVVQAVEIVTEFLNLVTNQKPVNLKKLPIFLNLYNQVHKQANRIKCASLVATKLLKFWKG